MLYMKITKVVSYLQDNRGKPPIKSDTACRKRQGDFTIRIQ